jgi:hypothetical protein
MLNYANYYPWAYGNYHNNLYTPYNWGWNGYHGYNGYPGYGYGYHNGLYGYNNYWNNGIWWGNEDAISTGATIQDASQFKDMKRQAKHIEAHGKSHHGHGVGHSHSSTSHGNWAESDHHFAHVEFANNDKGSKTIIESVGWPADFKSNGDGSETINLSSSANGSSAGAA